MLEPLPNGQMDFVFDDGGRETAGFKGFVSDCVCRSIAIATRRPYREIYDLINRFAKRERMSSRKRGLSSARLGVNNPTIKRVLTHLGWAWFPTMFIGSGTQVHLRRDELPTGRLIVSLSKHYTTVINRCIFDIGDPSRDGKRCVYGFWYKPHFGKEGYGL